MDYKALRPDLYKAIVQHFGPDDLSIIFDEYIDNNPEILGNHAYKLVTNPLLKWPKQCSHILSHAYANNFVPQLVNELQAARPNTMIISKLFEAAQIGVFEESSQGLKLQGYIRKRVGMQDPYEFISNIIRATRRTCILTGKGQKLGTGILISDDQILTNHHVYEKAKNKGLELKDINAIFDYAKASDGMTVKPGKPYLLDCNFEPILSRCSKGKYFADEPDKLDYCLLKLVSLIGEEQNSKVKGVSEERGHFLMTSNEIELHNSEDVFIFHHPNGETIKCSPGQFESYENNEVRSRVRYDAPTLFGSSGGAVLNSNFDLVAIHHAGDGKKPPEFNQGIPIHLIKKDIESQLAHRRLS